MFSRKVGNEVNAFLALLRAGLWEKEARLSLYENIDCEDIYRIAEEQSVIGLIAAGVEHLQEKYFPKEELLALVGAALKLENRNVAMNSYLVDLIGKLREANIYTILVKGQGIAQCYERPLWRAAGDIDLLLSKDNYNKADTFLRPIATKVESEDRYKQHLSMSINDWEVELHGTMRTSLWRTVDNCIDEVQEEIFYSGSVRSWMNGKTQIFLPNADADVIFVFTHILQHFFKEGIGLRQICDWCRLLWTYRYKIDNKKLNKRLHAMGVVTEWKAFASLAVNLLGMPKDAMPFYDSSLRWKKKAERIMRFIIETGNFGHNRDYSYYNKHSRLRSKLISLWRHTDDGLRYSVIFPVDSMKVWCGMIRIGIKELFVCN